MRATTFCNHYRAMGSHTTCEAGVEYATFNGMKFHDRPCFGHRGEQPPGGCDLAQFPTEAELAAEDAEDKKRWENLSKARAAIVAHLGGPWKRGTTGAGGTIECPVCAGALQFTRAGYNGHIHARCSTAGCVSWME